MRKMLFLFFIFGISLVFAQNYLLDFDGIDDYIAIPGTDSINTNGTFPNRTIELWFQADTLITDSLQTIYEEGGKIRGFHIYIISDTLYVGGWNENETSWDGTWHHHEILADKWYHVALVLDHGTDSVQNNKLYAYLNGYEFSSGNKEGSQLYSHGGDIHIGRHGKTKCHTGDVLFDGGYFHGQLNEVRVWNTPRTQQQIKDNMHNEISVSSRVELTCFSIASKVVSSLAQSIFSCRSLSEWG